MDTFDKFFIWRMTSFNGRIEQVREEILSIEMCLHMFEEGNFRSHRLEGLSWDNFRTTKHLCCLYCVELVSVIRKYSRDVVRANNMNVFNYNDRKYGNTQSSFLNQQQSTYLLGGLTGSKLTLPCFAVAAISFSLSSLRAFVAPKGVRGTLLGTLGIRL